MKTKLSLAYSPCPNDCFIFDALVHGKIDCGDLSFEPRLEDVEALNQNALRGRYDISKLSFAAYARVLPQYIMLRAGSALGFNCGPLLVQAKGKSQSPDTKDWKVAIPGELTTANFLLSIAYPKITHKLPMLFSEIEEAVLQGKVDAGLIIHESRFTYQEKGLEKISDLGEYWDKVSGAPIPLGGIAVRRNLPVELQHTLNRLIRESVEYAFAHPESSMPYVRAHAQEMSEAVMKQHIALYVNAFSLDLGEPGKKAVELLFSQAGLVNKSAGPSQALIL